MTEAKLASAAVTRTRRKNEKGQFFDVTNKKKFVAGKDGIYISEGGTSKSTVTSTYESETSALYEKNGVAGLGATQGVLAQTTIGFDAAAIVGLVTKYLAKLRAAQNGRDPYIIPIYDAIITDAGSFMSSYKAINDVWLDMVLEYDLIGEMQKGIREATHRGIANLRALAEGNPSGSPADPNYARYVYNEMSNMGSLTSIYHPKLADRAFAYVSNLDKKARLSGDKPWDHINNKELYALALAVLNDDGVKDLAKSFEGQRLRAKEGRKKIRAKAKDTHQYTLDALREADPDMVPSKGKIGTYKGYNVDDLITAASIANIYSSDLDVIISELDRGRDAIGLTTKDPIEIAETIQSEMNEQSFNRGEEYGYDSSTEIPEYGYDRRNDIPNGGTLSTHKGYNINELRIAASIVNRFTSDLDEIVEYLESGKDRFGLTTSDPIEIAEVIKSELDEYNNNYN